MLRKFPKVMWEKMNKDQKSKWKVEKKEPEEVRLQREKKEAKEAEAKKNAALTDDKPQAEKNAEEDNGGNDAPESNDDFKNSKDNYSADDAIQLIKKMKDVAKIEKFVEGDTRKTVKNAANTRIQTLNN